MTKTRSGKSVHFQDNVEEEVDVTTIGDEVGPRAPPPLQPSVVSEHISVGYKRTRKRRKNVQAENVEIETVEARNVEAENVEIETVEARNVEDENVEADIVVDENVEADIVEDETGDARMTDVAEGSQGGGAPVEEEDECDSDDDVVLNTDTLLGEDWKEHVGFALLHNANDRGIITCKQSTNAIRLWKLHEECDEFKATLKANPLYILMNASYSQANRVIVSAFVERWHPETNTFHLPFGEMTITLDDVRNITCLPVVGKPVNFEFPKVFNHVKYVHDMLGIDIATIEAEFTHVGGLRLSRSWLKKNLAGRCGIRRKTGDGSSSSRAVISVEQAVRGFLLYLLSCTLFPNRSGDKISIAYIHFLEDLDNVGQWAWGTAALANLYRQLSQGSRVGTAGVSGYLSLLEAWVYEHFPSMRAPVNPDFKADHMIRLLRWKPVCGINVQVAESSLKHTREDIDLLEARDVVWDAYRDIRTVSDNDVCWFYGCIRTLATVEVYHPNRVVRQFGHVQSVPQSPIPPKEAKRTGSVREYNVTHESRDDDFLHYLNHLVNKDHRMGKVRFDSECTDGYMRWYRGVAVRRLTGVKKTKQRHARQEESSKNYLYGVVDDAIRQATKITKNHMLQLLKMTRTFLATGMCKEVDTFDGAGEEDNDEDQATLPRRRSKSTRKR